MTGVPVGEVAGLVQPADRGGQGVIEVVGSEMCIRDRDRTDSAKRRAISAFRGRRRLRSRPVASKALPMPSMSGTGGDRWRMRRPVSRENASVNSPMVMSGPETR